MAAWETAAQIALRNRSKLFKRNREESQHICDFGEGGILAFKHVFFPAGFC